MWRNGQNGDGSLARTIEPEDAIGGRSLLLRIRLKNLFTPGTFQRMIFVGLETWMFRICLQQSKDLLNGFQPFGEAFVLLKLLKIRPCLAGE